MGTLGQNEANWTRLYPFFVDRNQEAPDSKEIPPLTVEQARQALWEDPTVRPEGIVLATRGGEWLGLSVLMVDPRSPHNFFTGVRPDVRGLGLARGLKLEVIRRARASGCTQLLTHNHSESVSMLAVNQRLGYERHTGLWSMRRTFPEPAHDLPLSPD